MRSVILALILVTSGCSSDPVEETSSCEDCMDLGGADLADQNSLDEGSDSDLGTDVGVDMAPQEVLSGFIPRVRLNESQVFGTTTTVLSENGNDSGIAAIARESDGEFEYETRLYYTDDEPLVQNASPHSPILREDKLFVHYSSLSRALIAEFSLDFQLQKQVEISERVFGIYEYGNQIVAFGEENISFVESTFLGLEVTKQIPRSAKPLPDFGTPHQQVIVGNVIFDVVRTMDDGKVLVAWNLEAEGADDALLGATDRVPNNDIHFSASVEHELIVSTSLSSESFEIFSLQVPPVFRGTFDSSPYLSRENLFVKPVIYKDWLILRTAVVGGDDVDYFVLDLTTENLDCIGKIQDGEFNRFGEANVQFYGLEDEIMVVKTIPFHNILDGIPMVSMQPEDFVLGPCF